MTVLLATPTVPYTVGCLSFSLINGMISYSDQSQGVGSIVTYSCDTDYTLEEGSTRTCQSDGTWSGSPSTCEGKLCS